MQHCSFFFVFVEFNVTVFMFEIMLICINRLPGVKISHYLRGQAKGFKTKQRSQKEFPQAEICFHIHTAVVQNAFENT